MVSVRAPRCLFLPGSRKAQSEPDDIQHTTHSPGVPITNKSCQTDVQARTQSSQSVSQSSRASRHGLAPRHFTSRTQQAPRPGSGGRPTTHPRSLPAPFVCKGARRSKRSVPRQHHPYHIVCAVQFNTRVRHRQNHRRPRVQRTSEPPSDRPRSHYPTASPLGTTTKPCVQVG